ncbi:hypothetical protein H4R35_007276 [Dimargaris xerosporica]|nr:hypothetical protein H4R35_007276 [Dimargaris xerosporica]
MADENMSVNELRSAYQRLKQRLDQLERQEQELAQREATAEQHVLQTEARVDAAAGIQREAVQSAKIPGRDPPPSPPIVTLSRNSAEQGQQQ